MDSARINLDRPNYFRPNAGPAVYSLSLLIAESAVNLTVAAGPQFRNTLTFAVVADLLAYNPRASLLGAAVVGPPANDLLTDGGVNTLHAYPLLAASPAFTAPQGARTTNPLCYMVNTPDIAIGRALFLAPSITLHNSPDLSGFARGTWVPSLVLHNSADLVPKLAALTLAKESLVFAATADFTAQMARFLNLGINLIVVPRALVATLPETFDLALVLPLALGIDPSLAGPELVFDALVALPLGPSAPWPVFYPGNTQGLRLDGLYEPDEDLFVSDASLVATLEDSEGAPVWGLNGVKMFYVPGTPASYEAMLDSNEFNPAPGAYTLVVVGERNGAGLRLEMVAIVETRTR
jgi:hypothetical protein